MATPVFVKLEQQQFVGDIGWNFLYALIELLQFYF